MINKEYQALYALLILIMLGLSGWYYVQVNEPVVLSQSTLIRRPDLIGQNITAKQFERNGQMSHQLNANKMMHYPHEDHSIYWKTHIRIQSNKNAPWTITANRADSVRNNQLIDLTGDIVIKQKNAIIKTQHLHYNAKTQIASTQDKITVTQPGMSLSGRGMVAHIANQQFKLLHHIQGRYEKNKI